jgi:hypothetical protein
MVSMNIWANENDLVTFANPHFGTEYDEAFCAKTLNLGWSYRVEDTRVYGSYTDVHLKEFPGKCFNSVNFIDFLVDEEKAQERENNYMKQHYPNTKEKCHG